MSAEEAESAVKILGFVEGEAQDILSALQEFPMRGALDSAVPVDPTIYRFYELIQVYGPTIKALIHEEFGDGIMSAIDFDMEIKRKEDPKGDRVVVTLNGKFLPYKKF
jgi:cyanate lyase